MILVSSEYAFPYRLSQLYLEFNLKNFNKFIYAGEVPPKDMFELLTTKWGVESNMALALINIYGGHIYDMVDAISRLYSDKEGFNYLYDSHLSIGVQNCLDWKFKNNKDKMIMRDKLRQLAVCGFVPLKSINDPVAKVISANNVGGVIVKSGVVIGLNKNVWKGNTDIELGIIPSQQSIRLAIAKTLKE